MFFQPICMCIYVYILVMHIPHAHYLYTVLYAFFIELHKFKGKKNPKPKQKNSGGKLSTECEPSGLHPSIDLQATALKGLEPALYFHVNTPT